MFHNGQTWRCRAAPEDSLPLVSESNNRLAIRKAGCYKLNDLTGNWSETKLRMAQDAIAAAAGTLTAPDDGSCDGLLTQLAYTHELLRRDESPDSTAFMQMVCKELGFDFEKEK